MFRSINWSSGEGRSSCETSSVALSELGGGSGGGGGGRRRESHGCHSPNPPSCSTSAMLPPHPGPEDPPEQHLVNRRALLERMGMTESLTDGSSSNKRATTSGRQVVNPSPSHNLYVPSSHDLLSKQSIHLDGISSMVYDWRERNLPISRSSNLLL